jgi:hypothetical protein
MKAALMLSLGFWFLVGLIAFATGCSAATGWRFEVGVAPVKSISNTVQTAQKTSNNSARIKRVVYSNPADTGY